MSSTDFAARLQRSASLLADLPAADLDRLAAVVEERAFARGEHLFRQDDRADGFHVIETGRVRVYRLAEDGREQTLHLFGPGELVGEVPVFHGGRYPACAAADGPVATWYLPRDDFVELGRAQPDLLLDLLAVLAARLRRFVGLVDDLALKDVEARLVGFLSERARDGVVELGTTKAVLANRLGTTPETLSRTLARLERDGSLAVHGRRIELLGGFEARLGRASS